MIQYLMIEIWIEYFFQFTHRIFLVLAYDLLLHS